MSGRLTGAEFAVRRHLLGLTIDDMSEMLGVNPRTLRSWESEDEKIPERITGEMDELMGQHAALAARMATDGRVVGIVRDKAAQPSEKPRGWYLAAAARALVLEPDLMAEWVR